VEPLPRLTLAAAQLKNQRDEQQARSGGAWDPEESLLALKGHVPDHVLHQLAPFQRDAVKFIMSNKGRALVADEMGLGELYLKQRCSPGRYITPTSLRRKLCNDLFLP
jgi:hypothetical protein